VSLVLLDGFKGVLEPHEDLPRGVFCSPSECVKKQNGETWCQKHLADQQLFQLLEKVDGDFAEEARRQGCLFCGGTLHCADYDRKPRGAPQWDWRYSFCCAKEDCRRRRTPPSVRFLGRKVYVGLVVVLLSTMLHGLNAERVRRIRELLNTEDRLDRRTLERWRQWWLNTFVRCSFWKEARARMMPPICEKTLPNSLCARFAIDERDRLVALLKFLAPITTPTTWKELVM
jgi:hypothetical protein